MEIKKLLSSHITTNTKEIKKNSIFIAINKGNDYIKEAIEKKAKYIISEKKYNHKKVITVKSTKEFLSKLGQEKRNLYNIPVIAVTGSCGKTTTKEFIYEFLKTKYNVLKSIKNYNNHLGVPLTLLNINENTDIAVLELGMNHLKEIASLSKMCKPTCAVITNIGTAHIGNLGSKKNIFKAKMEILEGMTNKFLIINEQDKYLKKLKLKKSNLKFKKIKYYKTKTKFILELKKIKYSVIFNIPGKHMLKNLHIAIKVAIHHGIEIESIIKTIPQLKNEDGRFKIFKKEITLIDDCYNSSYEALKESLKYLKTYKEKKVIILSDMLELGKFSKQYHHKINRLLKKITNKEVYLTGEYTKYIKGKHFKNNEELIKNLKINKNDIIFIKGSNSTNIKQVSEHIKQKYNLTT